jgi:hypothetical protein
MLDRLHGFWTYITAHPSDIGWAAFFALFFALILDLLDRQGRIRTGIRHLKNKLAERSTARLRNRINQLETQRNRYAEYISSNKALYLDTFRTVIGMLMGVVVGSGFAVLMDLLRIQFLGVLAVYFYILAVIFGIQGFKISSLDSNAKITATIIKLNEEISDLKKKLEERAR